jgi:fumarylacetoacetate (FAA) hydrolase
LHRPLITHLNGELYGNPDAGPEMHFSFHEIVAHICKTRSLSAGTIVGSGTISNVDRSKGSSCLAEKRMIEKIDTGEFSTPFMTYGDNVSIEMFNEAGDSLFGRIEQTVVPMS